MSSQNITEHLLLVNEGWWKNLGNFHSLWEIYLFLKRQAGSTIATLLKEEPKLYENLISLCTNHSKYSWTKEGVEITEGEFPGKFLEVIFYEFDAYRGGIGRIHLILNLCSVDTPEKMLYLILIYSRNHEEIDFREEITETRQQELKIGDEILYRYLPLMALFIEKEWAKTFLESCLETHSGGFYHGENL